MQYIFSLGFSMRLAARRDANEDQVVSALEAAGAYVKKINDGGTFDLLVWYRGNTLLLECKDGNKPPSARKLTPAEQKFHDQWPGNNLHVVLGPEDAVALLRTCG
jgi:hypothetical protein